MATRAEKILSTAARFPEAAQLAARCVQDGTSFSSFQKQLLETLADIDNPGRRRIEVGSDGYDAWKRAAPDVLMLRGCGRIIGNMSETERAQRTRAAVAADPGCDSRSLLRAIAERATRHVRKDRHGNDQFEARAFSGDSDFGSIVNSSLNTMAAAFFEDSADRSYESIATVIRVPDFRPTSLLKWSIPNLTRTGELVPAPEGVPYDARQQLTIESYQEGIGIGRHAFINDSADTLASMAQAVAEATARTICDTVYAHLLANPVQLEDGIALFATNHTSGANTTVASLDSDGLGKVFGLIRSQKSTAGNVMNLRPGVVLVPSAELEGKANTVIGTWNRSDIRVVVEPRLTPATTFYAVAPRYRGLVIGSLSGTLGPSLNMTRQDPMGIRWIALIDFGVAVADHRPLARGT